MLRTAKIRELDDEVVMELKRIFEEKGGERG